MHHRDSLHGAHGLGRLDRSERLALAARAVGARLSALVPRFRRPPLAPSALRSLPHPSGALAREADRVAAGLLAPWLLAHSSRTFAWAALLGARDGVRYDAELLYTAAMLHDLGLTPSHAPPSDGCFALSGARAAELVLQEAGADRTFAARVAEAIALHVEVRVALEVGPEAHLLNRGAAFDLVGREARSLSRALRDEVVDRWPRQGCKAHLRAALHTEARRAPQSRVGVLVRLGLLGLIQAAPFHD